MEIVQNMNNSKNKNKKLDELKIIITLTLQEIE
jgi:hypothetical protein